MEEKDLIELSGQLMNPNGEKGIEIANMMNETNRGMTVSSINNLQLKEGNCILEIGHGNAGHLNYLFEQAPNLSYKGIDISDLMIQEAGRINESLVQKGSAEFIHYNGMDIPFENDSFDSVFTVNTLYFWRNPNAFLKEIVRIMKVGGHFSLTFAEAAFMEKLPFTKFNFTLYTIEKVKQLIEKTNLKIVKIDSKKEEVKSKTGDLIEREFVTILSTK
jgi:ubiquinone/menaquinone biosynthesis C-methylase UbiE